MAAPDEIVATREICCACLPRHPSPKLVQLSLDESEAIFHGGSHCTPKTVTGRFLLASNCASGIIVVYESATDSAHTGRHASRAPYQRLEDSAHGSQISVREGGGEAQEEADEEALT